MTAEIERPCPTCEEEGRGRSRIGNKRSACKTCNAFARRLEREVSKALRVAVPEAYEHLREETEARLYADLTKEGMTP